MIDRDRLKSNKYSFLGLSIEWRQWILITLWLASHWRRLYICSCFLYHRSTHSITRLLNIGDIFDKSNQFIMFQLFLHILVIRSLFIVSGNDKYWCLKENFERSSHFSSSFNKSIGRCSSWSFTTWFNSQERCCMEMWISVRRSLSTSPVSTWWLAWEFSNE